LKFLKKQDMMVSGGGCGGLEINRSGNMVVFFIYSFLGSILAYVIEGNVEPFVLPINPW
jgi:hypothetical protein